MSDAANKAAYHTTKFVLGRKVMQIVLEVPMEQAQAVYSTLGYPMPNENTWVGVALLSEPQTE